MRKSHYADYALLYIGVFLLLLTAEGIANTFVVTNTGDSGAGSLRQAMTAALGSIGSDTIIFNIPISDPGYDADLGIWKIQPVSPLPAMRTDGTVIDGASQAAFIGGDPNPSGPEIVVDGSQAGETPGLYFRGSNNQVRELVIQRFSAELIDILGDSNIVAGCYIGPDATGAQRYDNYQTGIKITGSYNRIGGTVETDRNVISGNELNGIMISNSTYNQILGNYIGLTGSGTDTLGNDFGIRISKSSHNIIGPDNVISGNLYDGIVIQQNSDSNLVIGNFIGTDPTGVIAWGNGDHGIALTDQASHNIIGGSSGEDRNIISGNNNAGISIRMQGTEFNRITGNFIGTDITGTHALPNRLRGISITTNAMHNTIGGELNTERNVISGNSGEGIRIANDGVSENIVLNNFIGLSASGTEPLANGKSGVLIEVDASNNTIGPDNVIAFNNWDGVTVSYSATRNTITRNSIYQNTREGINTSHGGNNELIPPVITSIGSVEGTAPLNATIEIFSGPDDEGQTYEASVTSDDDGNFFWAGTPIGPYVTATATDSEGNTSAFSIPKSIAPMVVTTTTDAGEGSLRWAIDQANLNTGPDSITFNIPISDSGFDDVVWTIKPLTNLPKFEDDGIIIDGFSQTKNQGDTNPNGPEIIVDGRDNTEEYNVGFRVYSARNVISGLVISGFRTMGMEIYFEDGHHNRITGNYIGLTAAGNDTSGNHKGISIGGGAKHNIIGGTEPEDRNVISGNFHDGISIIADSNTVIGNYIGTDADGMAVLGNCAEGISIDGPSTGNRIGGNLNGESNIISGNNYSGITITGESSFENVIIGNIIGLNVAGSATLSNGAGISLEDLTSANVIGGTGLNEANIISGNTGPGIWISTARYTQIVGNRIGADLSGQAIFPNGSDGISLCDGAQHNTVGPGNIICFNGGHGVSVNSAPTFYNTITQNSIFDNDGKGILLYNKGNNGLPVPIISCANPIEGTAPSNSVVEIFADSSGEGQTYIGTVVSNAAGTFRWEEPVTGSCVTATATDELGNTSEFSNSISVGVDNFSQSDVPNKFSLKQNFPNPFNPTTTIDYSVPRKSHVKIKIIDLLGREVRQLITGEQKAGNHHVTWNGLDNTGSPVASGIYFYQMTAEGFIETRKLLLIQ